MKTKLLLVLALASSSATSLLAQKHPAIDHPPAPDPVPIYLVPPTASTVVTGAVSRTPIYVYDQKPLPPLPGLFSPEQAQGIIDRFRTNYVAAENPRILIYVNRKILSHEDPATPLADRQFTRDVERLFGRPLRFSGATLVDPAIASQFQLIGDRLATDLSATNQSEAVGKERESLRRIADVALEVLITSRDVSVPGATGYQTYSVPEIQATAIRLRDARVIGQATAADLIGRSPTAGQNLSFQDITEATSLALMADLLQEMQSK